MLRKTGLMVMVLLVVVASAGLLPVLAQDGTNASTAYQLKLRTGPGTSYDEITVLPAGIGLILEARNPDTSWVLGRTADGAFRGWLASLYLSYQPGFSPTRLPVSGEIVGGAAPGPASAAPESGNPPQEAALGGVTATTAYQLNVRSGPGKNYDSLGMVAANTGLVLEARNGDSSWVLAHTEDGSIRGWLASLYLRFTGVQASSLPYSEEIIAVAAPAPGAGGTNYTYQGINMGPFDPAKVKDIDLSAYPIVGQATGRARAIFQEGRARGNDPHVVAKVGDCSSAHWYFLDPFGYGQYTLGTYTNLQGVVDQFGQSMAVDSRSTHNGFNVNAVLAPEWANPAYCQAGESPLKCEFRLHKASVAIIMFGTSDLLVMTPYEFDFYMRQVVTQTIEAGVIPILSTFPGNLNFPNHTILYNQIVVRIALDNDIPLMNLWLALEPLPNHGLTADGFHLSEPPYGTAGNLVAPYLQTGYVMRNLVTLQTLDAVWRGAMR
jgi:uncharacterized protein YraI